MRFGMTLRWWWARLSGRATPPRQVLESTALVLEKMHINRQLLRAPLAEMPVSGAERLWWRERFGRPDGYVSSDGKRSDVRSHLIERHWENRWWSVSPRERTARWAEWERRGLVERTSHGTYQVDADCGVTVLEEMWRAKANTK
jgi:hypothetical protein